MGLTIYLIGFFVMFIGGVAYLRDQSGEVDAIDVSWTIIISAFWFLTIPTGLVIGLLQGIAVLVNKGKRNGSD